MITNVLVAIAFLTLGNVVWLRLDYAARMPLAPDPKTGRTQAIIANHGRVYVTPEEAKKLSYAQAVLGVSILLALSGIGLASGGWNHSSQSGSSKEESEI
jgi:hypothetical protein